MAKIRFLQLVLVDAAKRGHYKLLLRGLTRCTPDWVTSGLEVGYKLVTSWFQVGYKWVTRGLQVCYEWVMSGLQ